MVPRLHEIALILYGNVLVLYTQGTLQECVENLGAGMDTGQGLGWTLLWDLCD